LRRAQSIRSGTRATITQAARLANVAGGLHLAAGCRTGTPVPASAAGPAGVDRLRKRNIADYLRGKETSDIVNSSTMASLGGFTVELQRSGREFFIPEGRTILEVLLDQGVDVDYSCELGICGTCEQRVISGIPEHHDSVLSEEEQAENTRVMICCAGCKTDRLVLDL
jgi:ferredoxin